LVHVFWDDELESSHLAPAVQEQSDIRVGAGIGILGFPYGHSSIERDDGSGIKRLYRLGPVLQQGHIGAITPSEASEVVRHYVLDVRTHESMAGSPVFEKSSGLIVAIHTVPTSDHLTFGDALSASRVNALLAWDSTPSGQHSLPAVHQSDPGYA
jgi:hypothetical protein